MKWKYDPDDIGLEEIFRLLAQGGYNGSDHELYSVAARGMDELFVFVCEHGYVCNKDAFIASLKMATYPPDLEEEEEYFPTCDTLHTPVYRHAKSQFLFSPGRH